MDRRALEDRRRIGTVRAAVNKYGERILESNSSSLKKSQVDLHEEKSSLRTKELHKSKRDLVRYKESRRAAESVKVRAESELLEAKKTVKDLAALIEESNMKVKDQTRDMERLKKSGNCEDKALLVGSADNHQYTEVMRELESVKQELSELKLNMAAVVEKKLQAEKEIASASSKLLSNVSFVEELRNKIDEVNEEQVLTELARIEAMKELEEIQIRREKEASEFKSAIEETRNKIKDVREEIDLSKELESKLAIAVYDTNVLQNELKLAKEKDRKVQSSDSANHLGGSFRQGKELDRKVGRSNSMNHLGGSFQEGKELGSFRKGKELGSFRKGKELGSFRKSKELSGSASLESITEELQEAKKELASIREEGFQFMTSMDIIRSELNHVTGETARLKKAKEKADLTAQNLNSKLLRAKSKLETASAVEKKATSILSNLSLTLEQLKTETEVAKKEKKLISEETARVKAEIQKTESQIDSTEEKLQAAIQELEAVKTSEASALDKLRIVIQNAMKSRASAAQHSSSITISKFEYEYLTGHAAKAEEIADKKVAAAQAWIEALKASEKEILVKIELAHKEIRETRVEEEKEVYQTESSLSAKRMVEGELTKWRRKSEKSTESDNLQMPLSRKPTKANGNLTPSRRAKLRKSGSPAVRTTPKVTPRTTPRSTSITIRKRRTAVPNLSTLFIGKRTHKDA